MILENDGITHNKQGKIKTKKKKKKKQRPDTEQLYIQSQHLISIKCQVIDFLFPQI